MNRRSATTALSVDGRACLVQARSHRLVAIVRCEIERRKAKVNCAVDIYAGGEEVALPGFALARSLISALFCFPWENPKYRLLAASPFSTSSFLCLLRPNARATHSVTLQHTLSHGSVTPSDSANNHGTRRCESLSACPLISSRLLWNGPPPKSHDPSHPSPPTCFLNHTMAAMTPRKG